MMEAERLVHMNDGEGKILDRAGFILSSSIPLQRSQTFESNGRECLDARQIRRRSSNGILKENSRKGRLTLRGGHELRLPLFEALGVSARFSKYRCLKHRREPT